MCSRGTAHETMLDSSLSNLAINASNFEIAGVRPNHNLVGLGGGINAQFRDRIDWFLNYNIDLGDRSTNQNATVAWTQVLDQSNANSRANGCIVLHFQKELDKMKMFGVSSCYRYFAWPSWAANAPRFHHQGKWPWLTWMKLPACWGRTSRFCS